jgi:transcriptional regulator with XRE-family HTH domain
LNPVYSIIGMHRSNYSKIENGQREISLAAVDKIAGYFNISIDELIHMGDDIPIRICPLVASCPRSIENYFS